mmetsp:Transcript_5682/g.7948  ORF Transcript_5682/g.7948 Transcript_5682/m.7948 type:complete len:314 (+) Transcript_5682:120-1061(+)
MSELISPSNKKQKHDPSNEVQSSGSLNSFFGNTPHEFGHVKKQDQDSWTWQRWLWIGRMKEDPTYCYFSLLPVELIRLIASNLLVEPELLKNLTDKKWRIVLAEEFKKPYFKQIIKFLDEEKQKGKTIFPPETEIFNALNTTPFDKVRVVIIGQDPYFNEGQAHGMCFSVRKGVKVPPSLNMMFKELERSFSGWKNSPHGCLESWAKQGVLLLNATLTVEKGKPNSHAKCGWQQFTDKVVDIINTQKSNVVFLLWGSFAQKKCKDIDEKKHLVLKAVHPSPMSGGGFVGCNCFVDTNQYLKSKGLEPINWNLD